MKTLTRFAASAATLSAIALSITMNGLYGWNWQPHAFGGVALAATAIIFDLFKAGMAQSIHRAIADGSRILATFQVTVFVALMALSLFTGLSFITKVIAGKQAQELAKTAQHTALAANIQATRDSLKIILDDPRAEGCMVVNGTYTRRWCSPSAPDGVPALKNHLERLTAQYQSSHAGSTTTWGETAVAGLTGWKADNIRLGVLVLMAVMIEIVSAFGFILLSRPVKHPQNAVKKPEPVAQTEEDSMKQLMQALKDHGIPQGRIAKAFDVNQSTVSRKLATV